MNTYDRDKLQVLSTNLSIPEDFITAAKSQLPPIIMFDKQVIGPLYSATVLGKAHAEYLSKNRSPEVLSQLTQEIGQNLLRILANGFHSTLVNPLSFHYPGRNEFDKIIKEFVTGVATGYYIWQSSSPKVIFKDPFSLMLSPFWDVFIYEHLNDTFDYNTLSIIKSQLNQSVNPDQLLSGNPFFLATKANAANKAR